jgi:uncharacterized protein YbjT (DUF2867 family)
MRVVVFGATGSVGHLAVEALLEQGHEVTAFARNPHKLAPAAPSLRHHAGDALSEADVRRAVEGQDAVIVALGAGGSLSSKVRSEGTLNVIKAMQAHGVKRLICQSTLGTGDSWENLDFWWKRIMFGLILRNVFRDHVLQERHVRASGLDWTILRPSAFSDRPLDAPVHEAFGPDMRGLNLKIARRDVAAFLARHVAESRYLNRAVALST